MVKGKKDKNTEDRILEAARKVFVRKGMAGARMQDIADEAGINKAMLHYYFRNKEKLFGVTFREAALRLFPRINDIINADKPLFSKIEDFCSEYIDICIEDPYVPLFVINEIGQNPDGFLKKYWVGKSRPDPRRLMLQIGEEVRKGTIRPVNPVHLVMNLLSMTLFPFIAKPVFQQHLDIPKKLFRELMEQRKKEIPQFIINAIRK